MAAIERVGPGNVKRQRARSAAARARIAVESSLALTNETNEAAAAGRRI